jgi:ADP-heptose:LPS heptosyltransferase
MCPPFHSPTKKAGGRTFFYVKILVIRFSSIGDIVLTSPVLRVLKNQIAGLELHFLTKKQFASLLEFNPHVDKIHALDSNLIHLIRDLRREKFDLILDLHHNLRTFWVGLGVNRPVYAFPKENWKKWKMVKWKIKGESVSHVVDRYMEPAIRSLFVVPDEGGLEVYPCTCELPEKDQAFFDWTKKPFVVFSIGGTHATKRMPAHKWLEFFPYVKNHLLVLIGGKQDIDAALEIEKAALQSEIPVWNACGKLTLGGSAWVIGSSKLVVSHDTGMMHIAAAWGKPVVAIWGNTVPEFGMGPYRTHL